MSFSPESLRKGETLILRFYETYEDFIDEFSTDKTTSDNRARLGMTLAAMAIGRARQELGLFGAIVATYRAFRASTMITSVGDMVYKND